MARAFRHEARGKKGRYRVQMRLVPVFAVIPLVEVRGGLARDLPAFPAPTDGSDTGAPALAPLADVARRWAEQGASRIQIVDLDAIGGDLHANAGAIREAVDRLHDVVRFDLVAGVRDEGALRAAGATGAQRVVVDAASATDPAFLKAAVRSIGDRVSLELVVDHEGRLDPAGAGDDAADIWQLLPALREIGIPHFLVRDSARSEHWWWRHHSCLERFCREADRPVTAGPGVATLERLHKLCDLVPLGLDGVVIGGALAHGDFTFAEAQAAAEARFDPYEWGPAKP